MVHYDIEALTARVAELVENGEVYDEAVDAVKAGPNCAWCKWFWHVGTDSVPTCFRNMQPAFPPHQQLRDQVPDFNIGKLLLDNHIEPCELFEPDLSFKLRPSGFVPPPKKLKNELTARVARARMYDVLSPGYQNPFTTQVDANIYDRQ